MKPTQLTFSQDRKTLSVTFEDGTAFALPAEYLRVESPSAEVRGHGSEERKIVPAKASVRIKSAEPTGNYAVRLIFDDGHDTGIYTWAYLAELGVTYKSRWADYLVALEAKGLSRT